VIHSKTGSRARLLGSAAALVVAACCGQANAQERNFDIPAQPLAQALNQFGAQSDTAVLVRPELVGTKVSGSISGAADVEVALKNLLANTGLAFRREGDTFLIVQAGEGGSSPQGGSAEDVSAVDALIVTAQKREEDIQDVPIAISAFTQEDLTTRQVAGGPDLMTQIPNMTFTKTNFTGYSINIRGIGTQAISATTDPAVAVALRP
jgi:outer membrane receptor protein involved in Fe transport